MTASKAVNRISRQRGSLPAPALPRSPSPPPPAPAPAPASPPHGVQRCRRAASAKAAATAAAALLSLLIQASSLDLYASTTATTTTCVRTSRCCRRQQQPPRHGPPALRDHRRDCCLFLSHGDAVTTTGGEGSGCDGGDLETTAKASTGKTIQPSSSSSTTSSCVRITTTTATATSTATVKKRLNSNNNSNNSNVRRTSRRNGRPPLVDSDLLRFLSRQREWVRNEWGWLSPSYPSASSPCGTTMNSNGLSSSPSPRLAREDDEEKKKKEEEETEKEEDMMVVDGASANAVRQATVIVTECEQHDDDDEEEEDGGGGGRRRCYLNEPFLRPLLGQNQELRGEEPTPQKVLNRGRETFDQPISSGSSSSSVSISAGSTNTSTRQEYGAGRVSQLLLGLDPSLDPALALWAGERVQAEAAFRTSRRSIREFLKNRDRQWKQKEGSTAMDMNKKQEAPAFPTDLRASRSYGFEDTLRLLVGSQAPNSNNNNATADHHRHPFRSANYGLTARDVCEILVHTPSVALMRPLRSTPDRVDGDGGGGSGGGETLEETLDRVMTLLAGTLGLRRYDARKVLRSCPGLLTVRGSKRAEQTIQMLTTTLKVSACSIARDKPGLPRLLTRIPSDWFRLVAFLASDAVRMPVSQIGPLLRQAKSRELLDRVAPAPVRSSCLYDQDHHHHHHDDDDDDDDDDCYDSELQEGTASADSGYSPWWSSSYSYRRSKINAAYRNMTRTAWTLRNELGTADLGRVIASYPSVLLLDAQAQVLPVARFLMDELGVWEDDLPRVLQLYPALLGVDLDKMRAVSTYLTQELDVDPQNLAVVFRSFPSLLTLSVDDDMRPVVQFLKEDIGIANVGRFVGRLPPVLGYSVDRELRPKWEFFRQTLGGNNARLEVTRFPACFSYPLERIIRTRFEYLKQVKRIPVPLVSLDQVLRYGDRDFSLKVARDADGGAAFAAFVERRAKDKTKATMTTTMTTKARRTTSSAPQQRQHL